MLIPLPFGSSAARVLIEPNVLEDLNSFRQLSTESAEAGGILMGYRRGMHLHVTEFSRPTSQDIQTRFSFKRHALQHQKLVIKRWEETGETMDYIGEWHTHPEDCPTPSSIDKTHWLKITKARMEPMIFLIIGRKDQWIGVGLADQIMSL